MTDLIKKHNAVNFYVGNNGNFDMMVHKQLENLSKKYPINYSIVLAYFPNNKTIHNEYTNTILPEGIEAVPKRFAISWRNKWMIKQSDTVITYVTHSFGGAAQFQQLAEKQGKTIINISEKII